MIPTVTDAERQEALKRSEEAREAMQRIHREVSGPRCKCAMCVPLDLARAYAEATYARVEAGKLRRQVRGLEAQVQTLQARVEALAPPF